MKLVIGSGQVTEKQPDTLYLDILPFQGVDILRDVEKGIPFDNNKFDSVVAEHVLEHMDDLVFVMNEIHRVLKPSGILEVEVPYIKNMYKDPSHKRFFQPDSLEFFMVRDINSVTAGVTGFFKLIEFKNLEDYGLKWVLEKK